MRSFQFSAHLGKVFLSCFLLAFVFSASAKAPNIIIILCDDLGYGDLGCYGHPSIRTPNIDRLASEGLRFTDFYSGHCVCTPSRTALMTGRLPIRSGMAGAPGRHVLYPNNTGGLPAEEITLAEALKKKDYATACIGKWHLGHAPEHSPVKNGFDYFFGIPYSNDMDQKSAKARSNDSMSKTPDWRNFNVPLLRNTEIIERPVNQETLTQRFTEEALKFIAQNKKRPFFLYFPHVFPHVPLFASDQFKGKSARGLYGDTVEEIDWSVGQIIKALQEARLDKETFIFFTSDNGPWITRKGNGGSAGLLRDGKGGTWEGGYRVPGIAWWPTKIKPGVTSEMANVMDLYATSLSLANASLPADRPVDGIDMSPILFGNGKSKRDAQFYYYADQLYAVRRGPFKAHFVTHDGYSKEAPVTHNPPLLFHVVEDPSERIDLAAEHPEIVAQLTKIFEKHRGEVVPGKHQF